MVRGLGCFLYAAFFSFHPRAEAGQLFSGLWSVGFASP